MIDLENICQQLQTMQCKEHGRNALATIVDGKIQTTTCCDSFSEEVTTEAANLYSINYVKDAFKDFGQ